jgi:hypothetical protein
LHDSCGVIFGPKEKNDILLRPDEAMSSIFLVSTLPKDTALALANYVAETRDKRQLLHPMDKEAVLISSTKCQRKARTWRFDPVQGKKVAYDWPCGGSCGKYHALSTDRIAKDTIWCLFTADEAKTRARHSDVTQNKYYLRQPDTEFMSKVLAKITAKQTTQNVSRGILAFELI